MKHTSEITPDDVALPEHPDGEMWPFVMLHSDKQTCADTAGELLAEIIPGYEGIHDDVDAFAARLDHAVAFAEFFQGIALDGFAKSNPDAATAIMDSDITLGIVTRDKNRTLEPALFGGKPWEGDVPAVSIVTSFYEPFSDVPKPTGAQIVELDPEREVGYLLCLAKAGLIELMQS